MEQRTTDNLLRKQALDAALSYALGRTHTNPADVIEIADTFYKFLCGASENV